MPSSPVLTPKENKIAANPWRERRRTPLATYRLQLHQGFGFLDAVPVLSYLKRLGITDCYTSPIFKARPGSQHGYDITDHHTLNPELGTDADYERFTETLDHSGMGHLLDFVPNHMGIDPQSNPWWHDVLENGPSSPFAHFFDIDWAPLKPELKNKVLLPILGEPYGEALEQGRLRLAFEGGSVLLRYGDQALPVNPRRIPDILKRDLETLQKELKDSTDLREFLSILTELSNLPSSADQNASRVEERQREKEVARDRLARLDGRSPRLHQHILDCVQAFNGEPGKPESFDALHQFLESQAYRLAYWKTASHEINYRRFFDVNQLAGLRMEKPEVFEATHERLLGLLADGKIMGLRLDHPDGLYDPQSYFEALQDNFVKVWKKRHPGPDQAIPADWYETDRRPLYLAAEKILSEGESLRKAWAIDGTSGYDFLNLANHLWIDASHAEHFKGLYERFIGYPVTIDDVVYQSKRLIMSTSMASELNVLAHRLNAISESNRRWRDFTLDSLRFALREIVACFPVYRTYVNGPVASPSDELVITKAVAEAKRRNPATESSIFDFVRDLLIPERIPGIPTAESERHLAFTMTFQQYTAPVQAKGVEDTAFYRCNMLLSLNEVGGDLRRFGISVSDFHRANEERQRDWPHSLLATSTHDTKRGEDSRARLSVLSEIPEEWEREVRHWSQLNRRHKTTVDNQLAPDANDEYFFYQALLGIWEPGASLEPTGRERLQAYMVKATREGKRHTSWIRPNEAYEKALHDFIDKTLTDTAPEGFLAALEIFGRRVAPCGIVNSLAQLALKMGCPGVPDFYQGTELWDWNLVDPDNRRPVDYGVRAQYLDQLESLCRDAEEHRQDSRPERIKALLRDWPDGRIKLLITTLALRFRRAHPDLFLKGSYIPLTVTGELADHVVAFARENGEERVIIATPRLLARFPSGKIPWGSTRVELPKSWGSTYRNAFTGETVEGLEEKNLTGIGASVLFQSLPVAWLSPKA